jgi:anti-sigma factor RsiW
MTSIPSRHDDDSPPPSRELDDLITRHLDGGLDAAEQRRLAALLDASPAARETLARYLRLEGALIRLASAGLVGSLAGDGAAVVPRSRSRAAASRWLRPAAVALAGSVLAATVVAVLVLGRPEIGLPRGGDVAFIADRWLELRAADAGGEPETQDPEAPETEEDEPDAMAGSPPGWLVAAVADEGAGLSRPDEG